MARKKRSVRQHEKTFIHIRKKAIGAFFLSLICLVGTFVSGWFVWFFATYLETAKLAGVEILKYQLDDLVFCIPILGFAFLGIGFVFLAIFVFAWGWTDKTFVELLSS